MGEVVELEMLKSNAEAMGFYARYGFETVNVLSRFYTDGEEEHDLRRHL